MITKDKPYTYGIKRMMEFMYEEKKTKSVILFACETVSTVCGISINLSVPTLNILKFEHYNDLHYHQLSYTLI